MRRVGLAICLGGRAEGVGVSRAGASGSYQFFAGAMHAGEPIRGIILAHDAFQVIGRFEVDGREPSPRSWRWKRITQFPSWPCGASRVTAKRFETTGIAGSAAYYRHLALRIMNVEPD